MEARRIGFSLLVASQRASGSSPCSATLLPAKGAPVPDGRSICSTHSSTSSKAVLVLPSHFNCHGQNRFDEWDTHVATHWSPAFDPLSEQSNCFRLDDYFAMRRSLWPGAQSSWMKVKPCSRASWSASSNRSRKRLGLAPVREYVCTECQRPYKVEGVPFVASARHAFVTELRRLVWKSHDPNQLAGIHFDEGAQIVASHLDPLIWRVRIVQRQCEVRLLSRLGEPAVQHVLRPLP